MILDNKKYAWIYVRPSTSDVLNYKGQRVTREEYLEHWGKWIIVDDRERLDELAGDLDLAVEHRLIYTIKYLRSANEAFGIKKPIMCVFCDDRERDEIRQMLSMIGATPQNWMYEREMWEKWSAGGEYLERWLGSLGLSEEEIEAIRQESKREDEAFFEYQYVTKERFGRLKKGVNILNLEELDKLPKEEKLKLMTPVVAIVGRFNVGKSMLFNQLLGRQQTIVAESPGTTRDLNYADTSWGERNFTLIDTGGLELKPNSELERKAKDQAEVAVKEADAIIFLVDGKEGMTRSDEEIAQMLRHLEKSVILAVNKIDNKKRQRYQAAAFSKLGLGEPLPISAYHNKGLAKLKDELVARFPSSLPHIDKSNILNLAIVGRPNAGKSMLLNALLGQERAIVQETPGTTRDATDTLFYYVDNQPVLLIDTAGLQRKQEMEKDIDQRSMLQARHAIDRADIVLLLLDAVEPVTTQDTRIAGYIKKAHKGVLIAVNKWDLMKEPGQEAMERIKKEIRRRFKSLPNAPVLFISAKLKQETKEILPMARQIFKERTKRIPTSSLNDELKKILAAYPPPSMKGENLEIFYATQAGGVPPTFIFFVNDKNLVSPSYKRYLENKLHEHFGFSGIPLALLFNDIAG